MIFKEFRHTIITGAATIVLYHQFKCTMLLCSFVTIGKASQVDEINMVMPRTENERGQNIKTYPPWTYYSRKKEGEAQEEMVTEQGKGF